MKLTLCIFLFLSVITFGQDLRNTHFFFNPLIDVNENNFVEASVVSDGYSNSNKEYLGLNGIYNINEFTVSSELAFDEINSANFEPSLLKVGGRYNFSYNYIRMSAGIILDLIDQFKTKHKECNSAFIAARYSVNDKLDLSASTTLMANTEFENFDELLGVKGILVLLPKMNLLAEINYSIEHSSIDFGGGLDYEIYDMLNLRAGYFFDRFEGQANTFFVGLVFNQLYF